MLTLQGCEKNEWTPTIHLEQDLGYSLHSIHMYLLFTLVPALDLNIKKT